MSHTDAVPDAHASAEVTLEDALYFRCPTFTITMPVSECKQRRKMSKNSALENRRAAVRHGVTRSLMIARCSACTIYKEAHAEAFSSEEMLARMEQVPSQESNGQRSQFVHGGSLNAPHVRHYLPLK